MRICANENIPSALQVAERIVRIVDSRNDWSGHFSVVEDAMVRMRILS